jgi:endoribonuclease Nob1
MTQTTYIIDTSAILSGKPINITTGLLITTPGVAAELRPGGRDYRAFQLLREKGLCIYEPSAASLARCREAATRSGDISRLSSTDFEVLAVALDINADTAQEAVILTDDYSIQNLARSLNIKYVGLSQDGITRRIKWVVCCPGCGRRFSDKVSVCPVCGTKTRVTAQGKSSLHEVTVHGTVDRITNFTQPPTDN